MLYVMEYPFGQYGPADLAVAPPNFLCPPASSLAEQCEKPKSPWLCVSTALQQIKHHLVFIIVLILYPKHNTIPANRRTIDSIPDETRAHNFLVVML